MAEIDDAQARLRTRVGTYGLPPSLADWMWNELLDGKSENEVLLDLYDRPEFKARFPGIDAARAQGRQPLSPEEYVTYENNLAEAAARHGLPPAFTDPHSRQFQDHITKLITNGISARQAMERVDEGLARVTNAPPEVRAGFQRLFGVNGDAALATTFLNPEIAQDELIRMRAAAEAAGTSDRFGVAISDENAKRLGTYDLGLEQLRRGFTELTQTQELYDENLGETQDLDRGREGVDAVFGLDGQSSVAVQKRAASRAAQTAGDSGIGADRTGAYGLGVAR